MREDGKDPRYETDILPKHDIENRAVNGDEATGGTVLNDPAETYEEKENVIGRELKRKALWSVAALVLAVLSVWAVASQARTLTEGSVIRDLKHLKPGWTVCAAFSMIGFIWFEGEAIRAILQGMGIRIPYRRGFLYAAGDVYFSAITPSASGGQPASAFFMMKDGISGAMTTAVLVMNLVFYTEALLASGIIGMLCFPGVWHCFSILSKILIVFGCIVIVGLAIGFHLFLRMPGMLEKAWMACIHVGYHWHLIKEPDKHIKKLHETMDRYRRSVSMMAGQKRFLTRAFFCNLAQRISMISVTAFIYLAQGGKISHILQVWSVQCFGTIGSYCAPIPGGMGVADFLLLDGFQGILNREAAVRLEILSRGLAFYVCVLISGIAVAIGAVRRYRREKKKETDNNI